MTELQDKVLEKAKKKLGQTVIDDLDSKGPESLKEIVLSAERAMKESRAEMEKNPQYRKAKDDYQTFQAGNRELVSFQRAKIAYALARLEELGQG